MTAIVTAANSFLTAPIAQMIGVEHLLASDPEIADGEYTGKIAGIPCFHEGKIQKLDAWLASRGEALPDFPESCFYGDSQSDVPLMEKVTNPVRRSARTRRSDEIAQARNWPVISSARLKDDCFSPPRVGPRSDVVDNNGYDGTTRGNHDYSARRPQED